MTCNMSSFERERIQRESKFTRGEKCIFAHVVITFVLIFILVIIYFIHVCVISHKGNNMFKLTRRHDAKGSPTVDYKGLGLVFMKKPLKVLCNSLLVQRRWSIAPGLCVAARAEPHLSKLLPFWMIKYMTEGGNYAESGIVRSLTHTHFNKDDLDNNIGLFEHEAYENVQIFAFPTNPIIEEEHIIDAMAIISWDLKSYHQVEQNDVINTTPIKGPMSYDDCRMFVSPITDVRGHEFCVRMEKENSVSLVHGALLQFGNSNIIGFFSWGQTQPGELPIVILNITSFKDWLEYITT